MILTQKEKEVLVIKLAEGGKNAKDMAQAVHVSLKDIGTVVGRYIGEDLSYQGNSQSLNFIALKLFKGGKILVGIGITLNMETGLVLGMYLTACHCYSWIN